jgi:hypothetical protein
MRAWEYHVMPWIETPPELLNVVPLKVGYLEGLSMERVPERCGHTGP